ncbi:MAG TPA: hypothetical protein VHP33_28130 [Polyangiaceae bacterium]|nr:hypothetical protein [Polyangiaceae bacterium]
MANGKDVQRPARVAKLERDLGELRSRLLRIQGEADSAIRDLAETQAEFSQLEASEVRS